MSYETIEHAATDASSAVPAELPRLTVLGTGYLGATHAICMAVLGYDVLGVDADRSKIEALASGRVPFFEPGLPEMLAKALDSGRLRFTTDLAEAGEHGDVHFICVGTPQRSDSAGADLRFVEGVARDLAPYLRRRCLVVGKSTVPVGTAARLTQILQDNAPAGDGRRAGLEPGVPARGVRRRGHPSSRPPGVRHRVGVGDRAARGGVRPPPRGRASRSCTPISPPQSSSRSPRTRSWPPRSPTSTRWPKSARRPAPTSRCWPTALSYDSRIGGRFLKPGLGFGGGCLPKDIRAFIHRAEELGVGKSVAFLRQVDAINRRRRERTVDLIREEAGGSLEGVRVCCLGAAFKPNSDDIRDAPALDVARMLKQEGAIVSVYDPEAMDNARRAYPELTYADSAMEAARDARVVALLTEWDQFRSIDPATLADVVAQPHVVDGRHALDAAAWRGAGWSYRALGRTA